MFETCGRSEGYRDENQDRFRVLNFHDRVVIVVADGAGGTSCGSEAAQRVVDEVGSVAESVHSADQWAETLRAVDARIPAGESTAVVVDVRPYGIAGASVGDSQTWLFLQDAAHDLTKNQIRKPLLGSGEAQPTPFQTDAALGVLLVGTDGFFNYVKRADLSSLAAGAGGDFYSLPRLGIDSVRLASKNLNDDTTLVAVRRQPPHRPRERYEIG